MAFIKKTGNFASLLKILLMVAYGVCETLAKPPFFPNPPEADKFLRLPCGMRSLFLWGQAQILTRHRTLAG
jgi:hypothetical protein